MKTDYHMHSNVSDGQLTPAEVVKRAANNGVTHMALTDHDDLGGWNEALATAEETGIQLITGVEISTTWHGKTIHILGYGFRPMEPTFHQRLSAMRATRIERSERIAQKLHDLGMPDTLAGAQAIARRKDPISRTHFARYLVQMGYCKSFAQAMNQYLADGKPGSVDHDWININTAVQWIQEAGGHAFIAHPLRYKMPRHDLYLEDLVQDFVNAGGRGIEVVYNNLGPQETERIAEVARQFHLVASRGSDFHLVGEGRDIGAIPPYPRKLTPIEQLLSLQ